MNVTSKEIVLYFSITVITILVALVLIRWLAPTLLGIPEDRLLVEASQSRVPFYEIIFNKKDLLTDDFILPDPLVKSRARQLYPNIGAIGPNDILGFRNLSVPDKADILVIGDSQTYGNNALIWENWPHLLEKKLTSHGRVYSMATGGWGAVQYFYAMIKGVIFQPETIIVAFYAGNDPLDAYTMAFSTDLGREFLPATELTPDDLPVVEFPPPVEDQWQVEFSDGIKTVFTPRYRRQSSRPHPAIDLAWEIMTNVVRRMGAIAGEENISLLVTIIPTKEYVYKDKVAAGDIEPVPDYRDLVNDEGRRIEEFAAAIDAMPGVRYVDVARTLVKAALDTGELYPEDDNGHPFYRGYDVIANSIAHVLSGSDQVRVSGRHILVMPDNIQKIVEIESDRFWIINEPVLKSPAHELPVIIEPAIRNLQFAGHRTDHARSENGSSTD